MNNHIHIHLSTAKMDPYAIITCRTQEQKSNVAAGFTYYTSQKFFHFYDYRLFQSNILLQWVLNQTGQGSSPEWNETFVFSVSGEVLELVIKIMDSDVISEDDFVGEAKYI